MRSTGSVSVDQVERSTEDVDTDAGAAIPEGWLQLASEWGRLARSDGQDLPRVLGYILGLLRGYALQFDEIRSDQDTTDSVTVWREPDNGFREALLDGFRAAIVKCAQEKQVVIEPVEYPEGSYRLTVPVVPGESAASLLLRVPSESAVHAALTVFQAGIGVLLFALQKREYSRVNLAWHETAAWVEMCKRAMDAPYFSEAVAVLVGDFQRHLQCDKVAIGICHGKRNRIEAVSGTAAFDGNSPTVGLMEAVVGECRAANRPLNWPDGQTASATLATAAHQELAIQLGAAGIFSYPLTLPEGGCGGVLITVWRPEQRMDEAACCFLDAVTPHVASLVRGLRQSDPLHTRKAKYLLWTQLSQRKKMVSKIALALVGVLALFPIPQSIRVDSQLEPFERRVVPVRYDGLLRESMVRPGDQVAAGDLLARLDDQELLLREAELSANRDRAIRRRDLAMTDPAAPVANMHIAQLEVTSLDQGLALLAHQREHLDIRSPIDGIVLAGDLDRSLGVPVSRGQALFEIGPLEQMVVEMRIPPRDISLIREHARVRVRLAGFPGKSWRTSVERIRPRTEMSGGRPVFVAEAPMPTAALDVPLRAGMHGRATLYSRYRPLLWVLTRRLFDFMHVTFFW